MSNSIRDALEAIAIMAAMIAVIFVPHPAEASMEPEEIKQLSNTPNLEASMR